MGALSKLEFILNPQVRTCSVVVLGTSSNKKSENWEPTGDGSLGDPCPEVEFSACLTSNITESDQEETQLERMQLIVEPHHIALCVSVSLRMENWDYYLTKKVFITF